MVNSVRELDMVSLAVSRWGIAPRLSSRIPFGYALDPDDPKQLIPVVFELEALDKARKYLKEGHSLRKVSQWLSDKTGRKITHEGLKQRVECDKTNGNRIKVIRRWSEDLAEAVKEVREFDLKNGNSTEWYDEFVRKLLEKTKGQTS